MGFTAELNQLRKILGENESFKREKKISLFETVVCLISTFSICGKKKTIADAHRNFISLTGKKVSRSSFWDRLADKSLLDFVEKAVMNFAFRLQGEAIQKLSWLSVFKDVLIFDASPVRLPKGLADKFPGNRKNHSPACLKLSALFSLSSRSVEWIELSAQKSHDSKFLPDPRRLKGSLFLFDLGYFSHLFLNGLHEAGVWFVCRLKANSRPVITKVVNGVSKKHVGKTLNKIKCLRGKVVEVRGKFNLPSNNSIEFRLIGFKFPKSKEYRWYVTNIPVSTMPADWIYPIYRLRWQIELFFKSIKTTLHADQITSENENIALTTCHISILSSLIADSIIIGQTIILAEKEIKSVTVQRITHVYSLIVDDLARCFLRKHITGRIILNNLKNLMHMLVCPNRRHRPTSLEVAVMLNS